MTRRIRLGDRLRRLAACVVVVLYAFLSTAGASLVLCQEKDGHIAIEWRGAACCAADGQRAPAEDAAGASLTTGSGETCDSCVDVPASTLLVSRGSDAKHVPSVPAPAQLPAPASLGISSLAWTSGLPAAGPRVAPIPPPPLAMLRTVVFRV